MKRDITQVRRNAMLAALAICLLSCTDSLTRLSGPRSSSSQDSSVIPAPITKHGCAIVEINIANGKATAKSVPTGSCGPVAPVISGTPTFDPTQHVVSLPIAIKNAGLVNIHAPVVVSAAADSIVITASAGQTTPKLSFVETTPTAGDMVNSTHGSWAFDRFLTDTSQAKAAIHSTEISPSRSIRIAIPPSVTTFRVPLHATGTYVFSIAMMPTRVSSEQELADSHKSENRVSLDKEKEHPAVRNKFWLEFKNSATIEDRQAALDAVAGTVVGGMWIGTGRYYYVRVPAPQDSGAGPLLRAMEKVKAMPGVAWVMPHELKDRIKPAYQRPVDSAGAYDAWKLSPDSATGNAWAAEAINAPLSWGCATGDTLTHIAVADQGFVSITDLSPNFSTDTVFQNATPDDSIHGTWVSSVLGAVGNNGRGIAGQMWTARLGLFWIRQPVTGLDSTYWPFEAVQRAAMHGYRVINISNAAAADSTVLHGHPTHADSTNIINQAHVFEQVIEAGNFAGNRALYVVAAGNDHIDAWWGGYATVKRDSAAYAPQILVVAADSNRSTHGWQLASFSNTGTLVDVAAPGVQVTALGRNNALVHVSGTSFSAPLVSGIAGQLLSFDSTITVDSAKSYIVRGATDGGRQVSTYYLANAYKALERAARRHGGPLCGNHLYQDSNGVAVFADRADTLYADRDSLGHLPYGYADRIIALHSGRAIYDDGKLGSIKFNGTAWVTDTTDTTFSTLSAAGGQQISSYNLSEAMDHNGDSVISISYPTFTSITINIAASGQTPQTLSTISTTSQINQAVAAVSPISRTVLVAVVEACCRTSIWTDIYSIPIAGTTQTATQIGHVNGAEIELMGFSEDGSTLWSLSYWPNRLSDNYAVDFWNPHFNTPPASSSPIEERLSSTTGMAGGVSPERIAARRKLSVRSAITENRNRQQGSAASRLRQ